MVKVRASRPKSDRKGPDRRSKLAGGDRPRTDSMPGLGMGMAPGFEAITSILKDAYGVIGNYYKEIARLDPLWGGSSRDRTNGQTGGGGNWFGNQSVDAAELATALRLMSQTVMGSFNLLNNAGRAFAEPAKGAEPPAAKRLAMVGVEFTTGEYLVRASVDPPFIRPELRPYVWPLRNLKADRKETTLGKTNVRFNYDGPTPFLSISDLPDTLETGTYQGPISQGDDPEKVIGQVFITIGKRPPQADKKTGHRKGRSKKR